MIEIENVIKSYGDHRVVDRLSLSVGDGVLCVLLGSSGCGVEKGASALRSRNARSRV